jgi:hypothetical protein
MFRAGQAVERRTGLVSPPELEDLVEKHAETPASN